MRKMWFPALVVIVATLILLPSYIRAYFVNGNYDAPEYVDGDGVLENLAAYDLWQPYKTTIIKELNNPTAGDFLRLNVLLLNWE